MSGSVRKTPQRATLNVEDKGQDRNPWSHVHPETIKAGHCILGHHPKIEEAMDLLLADRNDDDLTNAKANGAMKGHFCVVMSDPVPIEDGEKFEIEAAPSPPIPSMLCSSTYRSRTRESYIKHIR